MHGQEHEFEDRLLIGEDSFGFNHLAQRAIEGFDGIGSVDGFADVHGIVKDGDDILPMTQPDLANRWV
jgi:hypothetical protein